MYEGGGTVADERDILSTELANIKNRIKNIVTQRADDLCWNDVYTELASLVGIEFDPAMLPREQFLRQCGRFYDSLKGGCQYETDTATLCIRKLESGISTLIVKYRMALNNPFDRSGLSAVLEDLEKLLK